MRVYRMQYFMPENTRGLYPTVEWFSSKGDASARRDALRKQTGKRMAFEVDRFNAPTSRTDLPKFLTNPEPFIELEPPLTLG